MTLTASVLLGTNRTFSGFRSQWMIRSRSSSCRHCSSCRPNLHGYAGRHRRRRFSVLERSGSRPKPRSMPGQYVRLHGADMVSEEPVPLDALVQVHPQQLKDDTQVITEHKVPAHAHNVAPVLRVLPRALLEWGTRQRLTPVNVLRHHCRRRGCLHALPCGCAPGCGLR